MNELQRIGQHCGNSAQDDDRHRRRKCSEQADGERKPRTSIKTYQSHVSQ